MMYLIYFIFKVDTEYKTILFVIVGALIATALIFMIYFVQFLGLNYFVPVAVFVCFVIFSVSLLKAIALRSLWVALISVFPIVVGVLSVRAGIADSVAYGGFVLSRSPLDRYKERCITASPSLQNANGLAFCEKTTSFWAGTRDIFFDGTGQIADADQASQEWKNQLSIIGDKATSSELYQIKKIQTASKIQIESKYIGSGYYLVSYPILRNLSM